jgi:hypothetical protein
LTKWKDFDPDGNGFIFYKDFWSFCASCIEKLGISYEEFMFEDKPGKGILTQLNIPVW